jgi:hypothetical protein
MKYRFARSFSHLSPRWVVAAREAAGGNLALIEYSRGTNKGTNRNLPCSKGLQNNMTGESVEA